ncbi:protein kinase domain-containing protein [Sorangium sp. So ce233]|uniref:protein kinase domain-containing protein n=1 Tax=Sorangium sp. So ce233 TaxID=3133290 RepID=UPI003F5FB569
MAVHVGQVLGGKYRLVRPIGAGGMGQVWEAFHVVLNRRIAVKLLSPGPTALPDAVRRFQREARAMARFRSTHVVEVYDFGVEEDLPYLVMELLEGEDLGVLLGRRRRLSLAEARAVFAPALAALKAAHDAGIIHRDLKPSNIFLAREGDDAVVKLLDFGIAKMEEPAAIDQAFTATGQMVGTPLFMSPEQIRGQADVDLRSDLYSLGTVIYLALTGVHPLAQHDLSIADLLVAVLTKEPRPASTVPGVASPDSDLAASDLGTRMDAFFASALARNRAQRFTSAHEMLAAFLALTEGTPAVDLRSLFHASEGTPEAARSPEPLASADGETGAGVISRSDEALSAAAEATAEFLVEAPFVEELARPGQPPGPAPRHEALIQTAVGDAEPPRAEVRSEVLFSLTRSEMVQQDPRRHERAMRGAALASSPTSPDPWLALGSVLPGTLSQHAHLITRFLRALFGRFARESAHVAQLFDPSFEAPGHYRFFAVFLVGSAQPGRLATQTFILQSKSLEEHLGRLDKGARKVVLAIGDSFELGAGVRQRIFALYRAHNALVVPMHVARLRAVTDDRNALDLFHEGLSDFNALPDPFAVNARAVDPTSLFGMRVLLGDLLRALERPALVSVYGPPGCGKTSLVEMARGELLDTRLARVRCVELARPSIEAVAREIARVLGDEGPAGEEVGERIARASRAASHRAAGQQALLVLEDADVILKPLECADEGERAAAQRLWTALGRACDGGLLSVVATSLSGFLLGEAKIAGWVNPLANKVHTLPIPPLTLPDVQRMLTELGMQINVRFDAQAIGYVHEVTAGNVYAVRRLCAYVVGRRRRSSPHGPLGEVRVEKRHLVEGARDLAAIGETFNTSVLPWLDATERLVLEAVATRQPRNVRSVQQALAEQDAGAVAAALDRLRRIGLVERKDHRERVAIPLLADWARNNLQPTQGEATKRRERQIRTLAIGCSITLLLLVALALWSRPREVAWDAGGCRYEIDYPGRAAPGVEIKLYAFRTCAGPPGDSEVRLRARAGTLAQLGAPRAPSLLLHDRDLPDWQQQEIPAVLNGLGRSRFELDVLVEGETDATLTLDYDWLAGVPELVKKLIAAASAIPAAIAALLAYGEEIAALVRRLFGRR